MPPSWLCWARALWLSYSTSPDVHAVYVEFGVGRKSRWRRRCWNTLVIVTKIGTLNFIIWNWWSRQLWHLVSIAVSTLTQASHLGRVNLNWENAVTRLACRQACGTFSWLLYRRAQITVYGTSPGKVVLDCIKNELNGLWGASQEAMLLHDLSCLQCPVFSCCPESLLW